MSKEIMKGKCYEYQDYVILIWDYNTVEFLYQHPEGDYDQVLDCTIEEIPKIIDALKMILEKVKE
jgi:hypothetical protein